MIEAAHVNLMQDWPMTIAIHEWISYDYYSLFFLLSGSLMDIEFSNI